MNDLQPPLPGLDVPPHVDAVRSAAGRLGGKRFHQLAQLGREYERQHKLSPGRQRLRQLVQLGRRYEEEHGLRLVRRKRKPAGDAWDEFLTALARVVKPQYRPAVAQLVRAVQDPAGRAA